MPIGGRPRQAEAAGGLIDGEAGEVAELDQLGGLRILGGQAGEGLVDQQDLVVRVVDGQVGLEQVDAGESLPALAASLSAGVLDQDAPHGLGGGGEEMAPAVPA